MKTECLTTKSAAAILSFLYDVVCIFEPGFCREVDRRGYQVPPLGPWKRECAPLLFIFFIFPSHIVYYCDGGIVRPWVDEELHLDAVPIHFHPFETQSIRPPPPPHTHTTQSRFYPLPTFSTSSLFLFFFKLIFLFFVCSIYLDMFVCFSSLSTRFWLGK